METEYFQRKICTIKASDKSENIFWAKQINIGMLLFYSAYT